MLDVQRTIQNLIGMEVSEDRKEFKNDVVCCFDTAEKEVIVSYHENQEHSNDGKWEAYEIESNSPHIVFIVEDGKITEVWED